MKGKVGDVLAMWVNVTLDGVQHDGFPREVA